MNIISYKFTESGFTLYGEIEGFEHNCTIGYTVSSGLTVDQLIDLASFTIKEAYDRFVGEV